MKEYTCLGSIFEVFRLSARAIVVGIFRYHSEMHLYYVFEGALMTYSFTECAASSLIESLKFT